jgi:hypothetical protein
MLSTYSLKGFLLGALLFIGAVALLPLSASAAGVDKTDGVVCPALEQGT